MADACIRYLHHVSDMSEWDSFYNSGTRRLRQRVFKYEIFKSLFYIDCLMPRSIGLVDWSHDVMVKTTMYN